MSSSFVAEISIFMNTKKQPEDEYIFDDTASAPVISDMASSNDTFTPLSFEEAQAPKNSISRHISKMLILVFALAAGYFYYQTYTLKQDPQRAAQAEVTKLVAQVSKIILLPENETPTVATVSDPDKLKDQPFFARSQKGDKVLIYTNSKKAILYNPTENKIVDVAPINIGNTATPKPTPKTTK